MDSPAETLFDPDGAPAGAPDAADDSVRDVEARDAARWARIKAILDRAVAAPFAQRAELIAEACGDDEALRDDVLAYLDAEDEAETFIDRPVWRLLPDAEAERERRERAAARRVGRYRLERLLGKGGMGEVHLAVREDDYSQRVALKRTLGPAIRDELLERFVNERQILADLQHPGIARLLDGGTDDAGLPYLVMEYVEGVPIDVYCDEHDLDLRQRLRLVAKVCRIVHHAHKNLIVHRDLKPSNILVADDGQPRLLDFGIAKLLDANPASATQGVGVLTPSCASPEQVMGETVTTACDVYALGVLLYSLTARKPPYVVDNMPFTMVRRVVCLQDVERPSVAALRDDTAPPHPDTAVRPPSDVDDDPSDAGAQRRRRRLAQQLEGDIDAIVMKALRKEAEHRYASAAELADDIDRYLDGLPVAARKGTWAYYAGKFLRRNKPIVALLMLILGLAIVAVAFGFRAEAEKRAAIDSQRESDSLRDALVDILRSPAPDEARGRDRTVREVVDEARPKIEEQLAGRPKLQAQMLDILGNVFNQLGDPRRALELHIDAVAREREHDPTPHPRLAAYIANVGSAYYALQQYEAAEAAYREALSMREQIGDDELVIAGTLYNLTNVRKLRGRVDGIEEAYRRVLELRLGRGAPPADIARSHHSLGAWALQTGRGEEAVEHLEEALRLWRAVDASTADPAPAPSVGTVSAMKTLARAHHAAGRLDAAAEHYAEALETQTMLLGEDHPSVGRLKVHVARLHFDLGEVDEAARLAREAAADANETDRAIAESVLAACRLQEPATAPSRTADEAREQLRHGLEVLRSQRGDDAFVTAWTRTRFAESIAGRRDPPPVAAGADGGS